MVKIVAVAGGIAVGKTTLGQNLASELPNALFVLEEPGLNPFLDDFYKDRGRWAFHSRIGMLDLFEKRMRAISDGKTFIVLDRTIHELIVFANLQLKSGAMSDKEYHLYRSVYQYYCIHAITPDIIVRVKCNEDEALRRMHLRGRQFEKTVSIDYLRAVEGEYDRWFAELTLTSSLMTVETDIELDLHHIIAQIVRLAGSSKESVS